MHTTLTNEMLRTTTITLSDEAGRLCVALRGAIEAAETMRAPADYVNPLVEALAMLRSQVGANEAVESARAALRRWQAWREGRAMTLDEAVRYALDTNAGDDA